MMKDANAKLDAWIEAELPSKLAVERRNKLEEVRKNLARREYGRVKASLEAALADGDEALAGDIQVRIDEHEAKRSYLESPAHKQAHKEERARRKREEKIERYFKAVAVGMMAIGVLGVHFALWPFVAGFAVGGAGALLFALSELAADLYVDLLPEQPTGWSRIFFRKGERA